MTSGRFAAETIIQAKKLGKFNEQTLSRYQDLLKESYVIKDLKKYKNASTTMEENPHFFNHYIPAANKVMSEMFTVDGVSKSKKQKLAIKHMAGGKSILSMGMDGFKIWRAMK